MRRAAHSFTRAPAARSLSFQGFITQYTDHRLHPPSRPDPQIKHELQLFPLFVTPPRNITVEKVCNVVIQSDSIAARDMPSPRSSWGSVSLSKLPHLRCSGTSNAQHRHVIVGRHVSWIHRAANHATAHVARPVRAHSKQRRSRVGRRCRRGREALHVVVLVEIIGEVVGRDGVCGSHQGVEAPAGGGSNGGRPCNRGEAAAAAAAATRADRSKTTAVRGCWRRGSSAGRMMTEWSLCTRQPGGRKVETTWYRNYALNLAQARSTTPPTV
jgi:hypothetical protein